MSACLVLAPILALIGFIVTCFFNYLSANDACCLHWGIFHSTTGNLSAKYNFKITPSGWAFSIWGLIYAYQALWLLYGLSLFCRKNPVTLESLYRSPVFVSPVMYLVVVLNYATNVGWLIIWDREMLWWGVVVLFLSALTLYIAIGVSMYQLQQKIHVMVTDGITKEIKLVIGLIHNGLGMYAAWVTVAVLLNLGSALIYASPGLSQDVAAAISLSILTLEIVIWVVLDNIVIERSTRFLFTPYPVLIWALTGSIDKNWDSDDPISILTAGLLAIVIVTFLIKIILVIKRSIRQPLYERGRGEYSPLNFIRPTTSYT